MVESSVNAKDEVEPFVNVKDEVVAKDDELLYVRFVLAERIERVIVKPF